MKYRALSPEKNKLYNETRKKKLEEKRRKEGLEMIQCKICGKWFRQVGSHVTQVHKMTAREYREHIGVDVKKGLLPDDLRQLYGEQAKENNTYLNLQHGAKYRFVPGDERAGRYDRSEQTMRRLKEQAEILRKSKKKLINTKQLLCQ